MLYICIIQLKTTTQSTNLQFGDLVGKINIEASAGNGGGGNGGGAGWYFYSEEGYLDVGPPTNNGNAIFLDNINQVETFNPNQQGGTNLLIHFNVNDSAGTSYSAQFSDATQQFSTVTITQGSNVAEYFNGSGMGMTLTDIDGADVFIIQRPYHEHHANLIRLAKDMGIKVICDYDDDLLNIPTHNPSYNINMLNRYSVIDCMTLADEIWTSTSSIKKQYSRLNDNIHVIPNAHNDLFFCKTR